MKAGCRPYKSSEVSGRTALVSQHVLSQLTYASCNRLVFGSNGSNLLAIVEIEVDEIAPTGVLPNAPLA